jgi:hypothetical protein
VVYIGLVPEGGYGNGFAMSDVSLNAPCVTRSGASRGEGVDDDDTEASEAAMSPANSREKRDMSVNNQPMTMDLAGINSEDDGEASETHVRERSAKNSNDSKAANQ